MMAGKNGFTKVDHLKAEWATKIYRESGLKGSTARAVHYFALGRTDYPVFNKKGLNKFRDYHDEDDANITEWIALAKRQALIDWDDLPDESVGEYGEMTFIPSDQDFSYSYTLYRPDLVELSEYLKRETVVCEYEPVKRSQTYHIELWVEKSTMNGILQPVCDKYHAVLVTFRGHCSWGAVRKLCKRVAADGRPALVFYLSDMDASGFRMAAELCDKAIELNSNFYDGRLNIRVKRIGLTPAQVVEHHIPMVNRKPGEKAHAGLYRKYAESYGLDPTKKAELDALERYCPGGVSAFVDNFLRKFYDSALEQRCAATTREFLHSISDSPALPEEVVSKRREILAGLVNLIQVENGLVVPEGESMEADVEPETEDPDDESWLLDTANRLYPSPDDIDCGGWR
jgi:hypothetical protein